MSMDPVEALLEAERLISEDEYEEAEVILVDYSSKIRDLGAISASHINTLVFSILFPQQRFREAFAWLDDAINGDFGYESWNATSNLGHLMLKLGREDEAKKLFQTILDSGDGPQDEAVSFNDLISSGWGSSVKISSADPVTSVGYQALYMHMKNNSMDSFRHTFDKSRGASTASFVKGALQSDEAAEALGIDREIVAQAVWDFMTQEALGPLPSVQESLAAASSGITSSQHRRVLRDEAFSGSAECAYYLSISLRDIGNAGYVTWLNVARSRSFQAAIDAPLTIPLDALKVNSNFEDQSSGNHAVLRRFIQEFPSHEIEGYYLELSRLLGSLPSPLVAEFAHKVIEDFLLGREAWADIMLWSLEAIRGTGNKESIWISKNYFALSLKAIGEVDWAYEILRDSWHSELPGSAKAMEWILGPNQSVLDRLNGAPKQENAYEKLAASWLDDEIYNVTYKSTVESASSKNLSGFDLLDFRIAVIDVSSENGGLTYTLLSRLDNGLAGHSIKFDEATRHNLLLGSVLGILEVFGFRDPAFLMSCGKRLLEHPGKSSMAYQFFHLATLHQHLDAYVPTVELLMSFEMFEEAEGMAKVSVWREAPGSADLLIDLQDFGFVIEPEAGTELSESQKYESYRFVRDQMHGG
jgi:hypothetical protein